jgi:hypothetical protein
MRCCLGRGQQRDAWPRMCMLSRKHLTEYSYIKRELNKATMYSLNSVSDIYRLINYYQDATGKI